MRIGQVIRFYRKRESLTQEQIANYLNISAPAVNKWENAMSYPDITLLAPLARILKIDVNTLLEFKEELTEVEINNFTKDVSEIILKDGYEKAFERGSGLIKEYSNCDQLMINIAMVLRVNLITSEINDKSKFEMKIMSWFKLLTESTKQKIASDAKLSLSAMYRENEEYEKAQELLDAIPEVYTNKKFQQALLFESSGKIKEAYSIYQRMILKNANEINGVLSLVISMLFKEEKLSEAEEYSERAKKLVELFDLGEYNKHLLDLQLAVKKQDREKTIEAVINIVNKADTIQDFMNSKLYSSINFDHSSVDKENHKSMMKMSIKKDENLDFVKDDPRIKFLLE